MKQLATDTAWHTRRAMDIVGRLDPKKTEKALLVLLFLGLAIPLGFLYSMTWYEGQLDSAFLPQLTHNIAQGRGPLSNVSAGNSLRFSSGLLTRDAADICSHPLPEPNNAEENYFKTHKYYFLYLLAPFVKWVPAGPLLAWATAAGHVGMLVLFYLFMRRLGIAVIAAVPMTAAVVAHPAWSQTFMGQIYVDRFFVFAGMLFLWEVSRRPTRLWSLIGAGILCSCLVERIGLVCGGFLLAYWFFHYDAMSSRERKTFFSLGAALFIFAALMIKFGITYKEYSTFMPSSLTELFRRLKDPAFFRPLLKFLAINGPFLAMAALDWRSFTLAVLMMIPNIVGTIGGAEKTGWATHYHSLYLPFLAWAAAMGLKKMSSMVEGYPVPRWSVALFPTAAAALLLTINPNGTKIFDFSTAYLGNNALVWAARVREGYTGANYAARMDFVKQLRDAVPAGSKVSMVDAFMPVLIEDRSLYPYPTGLDAADQVIVGYRREGAKLQLVGAPTYLGPDNETRLNACLQERLKKSGFDIEHPLFLPVHPLAVVKRISKANVRGAAVDAKL